MVVEDGTVQYCIYLYGFKGGVETPRKIPRVTEDRDIETEVRDVDRIRIMKVYACRRGGRVSSKQTENFGSNRNKAKQDLFRLCFGLFCETKN
jgi:hypothetical protein